MLNNKTILITGGTGSFGNAVLNKMLDLNVKEIRIFSRDEKKQEDMRQQLKNNKIKFYIGDVRDYDSISAGSIGVDYIFHAAALKQVPSCEFYPIEAVRTNIMGTQNVINASIKNNIKKAVILSTDKAVYPINAMGISKAMSEKIMVAACRNLIDNKSSVLCGTRYGNVMASRGSVIPLFVNQIKQGKPITITNPKMTRFMMSLDEAINLVLFAFNNADQGDIFVQKSPSTTILELAEALKEIFNSKSEIKVIGTRHGEKLYETLMTTEEMSVAEELEQYYRIPMDNRNLNYENYIDYGNKNLSSVRDYNSNNTIRLEYEELKQILLNLSYIKDEINNY